MTHTPHDALFKAAFQDPAHAAAEFRALLPPEIVRRIDWRTLTLQPGSFVDPALRQRHSDLLFSARLGRRDVFIHLLLEHQSKVDRFLVLRMLIYVVRIWERYLRKFPKRRYLPPVLPIVIHHGKKGWTVPRRMSELLRPSPDDLVELRGLVPDMSLLVDEISSLSDASLRARALAPFPALALAALRDARHPGRILPSLRAWPDALRAVLRAPDGARAFEQFFRYIALVAKDLDLPELQDQIAELVPDAETRIVTIAKQLRQEGFRDGRDQGLKLGRDQGLKLGRDQGLRDGRALMLVNLLELKFGPLRDSVRKRIARADVAMLDLWSKRVLTASALAEVFAPRSR